MCGIDLIGLMVAAVIIGLLIAIVTLLFPKLPFFGGIIGTIVQWILWAIVAIFVITRVVAPLLSCAAL